MFVQETHSDSSNEVDWTREWPGQVVLSHGSSTSAGVGILFSQSCPPVSLTVSEIVPGRLLVVRAMFSNSTLVLVNIYAPTIGAERLLLLNKVNAVLMDFNSEDFLVLGGDFNCTENANLDRNHMEPHSPSKQLLSRVLKTHELVDVWKSLHGQDRQTRQSDFENLRQWWDCGKVEIKQFCLQYTLNITRDITRSMKDIGKDIVELQNMVESTGSKRHIEVLKSKKATLDNLLGTRAQGALVRSRFQSVTDMDAPSRFFFSLEKRNGQNKSIHSLRSAAGVILEEPGDIRRRAVEFYRDLFQSEYTEDEEGIDFFCGALPQVSEETNDVLDMDISLQELSTALQGIKGGRAPGLDGLTVEFYKTFWCDLGADFLSVVHESLAGNLLPLSCRRAVLTLLPKKGDLQDIRNWCPVSLLCTDYKILSKTLANRLREVMDQIVHQDQTYCVPGRLITDNIILIRDILDLSGSSGIDLGLISLDQNKAFDRVEHPFLWKTLEKFGLSSGLIAMIRVLYQGIESALKINDGLSAPFKVGRGIRQGCSLSGMLYALSIEPLLCKIRSSVDGLFLPDCTLRLVLSAYADDVVVLVRTQHDIQMLEKTVKRFNEVSSAKVNWNKSEALAVGSWKNGRPRLPGGLIWKTGGFKYLGVHLGSEEHVRKNWDGVVEKVEGRLQKWGWLVPQMSYRGRTLIVNNLVASGLWHRLACVEPPPDLLKLLQSKIVDFFWDRLHWLPQCVLHLPKDQGGQGLVHLSSRVAAFRIQFAQRFLCGPADLVWRPVASAILKRTDDLNLDTALFLMDYSVFNTTALPAFYQSVFRSWGLFQWRRLEPSASLHWLLVEPLIHKARLEVQDSGIPGITHALRVSGMTTLRHLVDVAGSDLRDVQAVASALGFRSTCVVGKFLELLLKKLTADECEMLQDYYGGAESPDEGDPFPELGFSLAFRGSDNVYDLHTLTGKTMYNSCVKVLNRKQLSDRVDTVWRRRLPASTATQPVWRVLYKPPLNKRTGDLQWRILHGAIAVNSFTGKINPRGPRNCVHCGETETVFHCFMDCTRLAELFNLLSGVFNAFNELWSVDRLILGAGYSGTNAEKWQLLNFLSGQAKLAIYKTRQVKDHVVVPVFCALVRARVWVDFKFCKLTRSMDTPTYGHGRAQTANLGFRGQPPYHLHQWQTDRWLQQQGVPVPPLNQESNHYNFQTDLTPVAVVTVPTRLANLDTNKSVKLAEEEDGQA
ncbi:transposon TX1 uncharacterized 149 kDa protein [Betta splendens]|uniref:Transposon TX1 uncharacterized 149 kDa protein n=1 Tax=Betta splendens TaxID=158456 RepID=A0A8M1HJK4_BETSP|nr:transposon TX1 uncharacterized 149 kDa protein [Betta splendens]